MSTGVTVTETTAREFAPPPARVDGFLPLRGYAVLGDGRSCALVGSDGAVDWWALPTMADDRTRDARLRAANRRTGLLLLAIALLFFFGIIASRFIESEAVSIAVIGGAVLLYLLVAIGRHLWK